VEDRERKLHEGYVLNRTGDLPQARYEISNKWREGDDESDRKEGVEEVGGEVMSEFVINFVSMPAYLFAITVPCARELTEGGEMTKPPDPVFHYQGTAMSWTLFRTRISLIIRNSRVLRSWLVAPNIITLVDSPAVTCEI
jgi:hypothetical protein